jgi:hypothetical protein
VSALDGGIWGLGAEFDQLSERLFAIAQQEGRLLSMRVRRPRKPARFLIERSVTDKLPAKKKAAKR